MGASESSFSVFLPCLEFGWTREEGFSVTFIEGTFLWHKHTGSVTACKTVYNCWDGAGFSPPPPHILTDVVDIQKSPFTAHTSVEQNCQVYIFAISCK